MSQYHNAYFVLSNIKATFEAQFMKKLSNTEAELKKRVAYRKKACNYVTFIIYLFFCFHFNFELLNMYTAKFLKMNCTFSHNNYENIMSPN